MGRKRNEARTRTGIDLDTRNRLTLLRVWFNARQSRRTVEVYETRKGYHLRVKGSWSIPRTMIIRAMLCDDPARLRIDEDRLRANYLAGFDLLFDHDRDYTISPLAAPFWEGPR